jgi:hypothetical protein
LSVKDTDSTASSSSPPPPAHLRSKSHAAPPPRPTRHPVPPASPAVVRRPEPASALPPAPGILHRAAAAQTKPRVSRAAGRLPLFPRIDSVTLIFGGWPFRLFFTARDKHSGPSADEAGPRRFVFTSRLLTRSRGSPAKRLIVHKYPADRHTPCSVQSGLLVKGPEISSPFPHHPHHIQRPSPCSFRGHFHLISSSQCLPSFLEVA